MCCLGSCCVLGFVFCRGFCFDALISGCGCLCCCWTACVVLLCAVCCDFGGLLQLFVALIWVGWFCCFVCYGGGCITVGLLIPLLIFAFGCLKCVLGIFVIALVWLLVLVFVVVTEFCFYCCLCLPFNNSACSFIYVCVVYY